VAVVALIGLSGSGKSTVAPLLGALLGGGSLDLDGAIALRAGEAVATLIRREGEAAFRAREASALREVFEAVPPPRVVACGGGILALGESRALLRARALVVWLRVTPEVAGARLGSAGAAMRPLLDGPGPLPDRLAALDRERRGAYEAAADLMVETEGRSPEEIAGEIHRMLLARGPAWGSCAS
jgi:shikimate kinase